MTEESESQKRSYPYMSVPSWYEIRSRLKQRMPKTLDADWVASALDVSQKAARNVTAQLRSMGLTDGEGNPNTELVTELRDDATYAEGCRLIVEKVYPSSLTDVYDGDQEDQGPVANWFVRNAGTAQGTAMHQARLYLTLARGALPDPDAAAPARPRRAPRSTTPKTASKGETAASKNLEKPEGEKKSHQGGDGGSTTNRPQLHIDLQIHIAADAGAEQIDAIFSSMAKHLYDREPEPH